jgi:hypothetical protein
VTRATSLHELRPTRSRKRSQSRRGRDEVCQRDTECSGKLVDRGNPCIAFAALDAANVIPVQIGPLREFLLRDLELLSQFAHSAPDGHRQIPSHRSIVTTLTTIGLHTIVFISATSGNLEPRPMAPDARFRQRAKRKPQYLLDTGREGQCDRRFSAERIGGWRRAVRIFVIVLVVATVVGGFVGGELMGATFSLTGAVVGGVGVGAVLLGLGAYFHAQEEKKKPALTPEMRGVFDWMTGRGQSPTPVRLLSGWKPRPFHKNESKEQVAEWFAHVEPWSLLDPRLLRVLTERLYGNQMFELFVHASQNCGVPRWTPQIRPSIDTSKPATTSAATETQGFYFVAASVRKSVWTFVRQLRGPHLSTCA